MPVIDTHRPCESDLSITVIGYGSLGETVVRACFEGAITSGSKCVIVERDDTRRERAAKTYRCQTIAVPTTLISESRVVVLVVKPQDAESLCREVSSFLVPQQIVLSLMAGIRTESLREWLSHHSVMRAMPNLPARHGEGMSVSYASPAMSSAAVEEGVRVLGTLGQVLPVDDEHLLDAATAISGTGPAYFFALLEDLEVVAREMGFNSEQARLLVTQTIVGSARMMKEPGVDPRQLRRSVTSPGGTTAAAFEHLDALGWGEIFRVAVRHALRRARELGGVVTSEPKVIRGGA